MMDTHNDCGCINGSVGLVTERMLGMVGAMSDFSGYVGSATGQIQGTVGTLSDFTGSVGIICTPNTGIYIRFDKSLLSWLGADNREGVTKYNTLFASGDWSLDEVQIEELL